MSNSAETLSMVHQASVRYLLSIGQKFSAAIVEDVGSFSAFNRIAVLIAVVALQLAPSLIAQAQSAESQSLSQDREEMATRETIPAFRVRVNQVLLRVVVHDSRGLVVKDLRKDDFDVRDNGKPQRITSFRPEERSAATDAGQKQGANLPAEKPALPGQSRLPERYIALLFDDLHFGITDLVAARTAAERYLATLASDVRAGVFTTSGLAQVDFTQDREQLLNAMRKLQPHGKKTMTDCPCMTHYFAELIINKQDSTAIATGTAQTLACMSLDSTHYGFAEEALKAAARQQLETGERDTMLSLAAIRAIADRMSALPGQRVIAMVSPGYLVSENSHADLLEVIDHALRDEVVVNTIDGRGLSPDPTYDPSFNCRGGGHRFVSYLDESARMVMFWELWLMGQADSTSITITTWMPDFG